MNFMLSVVIIYVFFVLVVGSFLIFSFCMFYFEFFGLLKKFLNFFFLIFYLYVLVFGIFNWRLYWDLMKNVLFDFKINLYDFIKYFVWVFFFFVFIVYY